MHFFLHKLQHKPLHHRSIICIPKSTILLIASPETFKKLPTIDYTVFPSLLQWLGLSISLFSSERFDWYENMFPEAV